MMRYILFQAYGKKEVMQECRFALLQLVYLNLAEKYCPVIYTDQPHEFKVILEKFSQHEIQLLDQNKISLWCGGINFVHRFKIMMIKDFFRHHQGSILYCDTDTYAKTDLETVFSNIDAGQIYMHTKEGFIDQKRYPEFRKWENFLRSNGKRFLGEQIENISAISMWNAGVIGMNDQYSPLLDEVLSITDSFYPDFPKHTVEQFAFSYVFQKHATILPADGFIYHYWDLKEYSKFLDILFSKDPLPSLSSVGDYLPEKILPEKLKYKKSFNWKVFKRKWNINKYIEAFSR